MAASSTRAEEHYAYRFRELGFGATTMIRTMHRFSMTLFLTLALCVGIASSQTSEVTEEGEFRLGVTAGITTFALGDLRTFTEGLISAYNASGLPVELERDYPPNLLVGAEFLYVGLRPWALGLSGSYTWTSAYALYGDYAGTLDLHSKVEVISGHAVLQYSFSAGEALQPFVDLRGGASWVFLTIDETVDAKEYTDVLVSSSVSGDKIGLGAEASVGLRSIFGSLAITGRAGYRYSNISSMEVSLSSSSQNLGSGELAFDINPSGFVCLLTLEIGL